MLQVYARGLSTGPWEREGKRKKIGRVGEVLRASQLKISRKYGDKTKGRGNFQPKEENIKLLL
jgi:hypothetical protein